MAEKASGQQAADALFLFDALQHVTSTVVINAAEIAAQTNAKVNTVQKRFSVLKTRYPTLNIQTTTTKGKSSVVDKPKPLKVTKPAPAAKKTATKKKPSAAKVAAIAEQLEDESDEGIVGTVAVKSEEDFHDMDETEDFINGGVTEEDTDRV